jgi:hypothetical protein
MNDALFCSIHVDARLTGDAMAALVAALVGGAVARRGVDVAWGPDRGRRRLWRLRDARRPRRLPRPAGAARGDAGRRYPPRRRGTGGGRADDGADRPRPAGARAGRLRRGEAPAVAAAVALAAAYRLATQRGAIICSSCATDVGGTHPIRSAIQHSGRGARMRQRPSWRSRRRISASTWGEREQRYASGSSRSTSTGKARAW